MPAVPKPVKKKRRGNPNARFAYFKKTKKVEHHSGVTLDSRGEAALFDQLLKEQEWGWCHGIKLQDLVQLTDALIGYRTDFSAFDNRLGERVYFEYKGMPTEVWELKRRLWKVYGPGRLRVYKGKPDALKLVEEVIPRQPKLPKPIRK